MWRYNPATLSHVSGDGYQVSIPGSDGVPVLFRQDADGHYRVSYNPDLSRSLRPGGAWVRVSGGDLPVPIELRIHRHQDGRYVVTGLLTGDEFAPAEITSQTLRQIRLSNILAWLLADFDPDNLPAWSPRTSILVAADLNAKALGHVAASPARGPNEQFLRDFARTYQIELARQPRRAMSAAAKAHNISRATANRWAAMCRERGFLPRVPARERGSS